MPISMTKGINFNSSGTAIFNNEIIFNEASNFNNTSNFNQNVIFNRNITTVSGTSSTIFDFQNKLLIPTVSGTENRLIWIT